MRDDNGPRRRILCDARGRKNESNRTDHLGPAVERLSVHAPNDWHCLASDKRDGDEAALQGLERFVRGVERRATIYSSRSDLAPSLFRPASSSFPPAHVSDSDPRLMVRGNLRAIRVLSLQERQLPVLAEIRAGVYPDEMVKRAREVRLVEIPGVVDRVGDRDAAAQKVRRVASLLDPPVRGPGHSGRVQEVPLRASVCDNACCALPRAPQRRPRRATTSPAAHEAR